MKGSFIKTDRFVVALAILGASAVAMQIAKARGLLVLIKKPLPIRRPLADFDRSRLAPYCVKSAQLLPADVVHELGTEEYVNWDLEWPDPPVPAARSANLFVTYYTGVQDQVPHVAEECMHVAGFAPAGDDTLDWGSIAGDRTLTVRRQLYTPPASPALTGTQGKTLVYYTFGVNGVFRADRLSVRVKTLAEDESHLYYSKVELTFAGVADSAIAELDHVAEDLLRAVLEELIESHWPPAGSERGGDSARSAGE